MNSVKSIKLYLFTWIELQKFCVDMPQNHQNAIGCSDFMTAVGNFSRNYVHEWQLIHRWRRMRIGSKYSNRTLFPTLLKNFWNLNLFHADHSSKMQPWLHFFCWGYRRIPPSSSSLTVPPVFLKLTAGWTGYLCIRK